MKVKINEMKSDICYYMLIYVNNCDVDYKYSVATVQTFDINDYNYMKDKYLEPFIYDDEIEATQLLNMLVPEWEIDPDNKIWGIDL